MVRRAVGVVVVVAAVLTGCGGSSGGAGACPSRRDVARIVGVEISSDGSFVGSGRGDGFTYESEGCRYDTEPGSGRPAGIIRVSWLTSDDEEDLFGRLSEPPTDGPLNRPFEPVGGLGLEARLDRHELAVRTADAIVFVEVLPGLRSTIDVVLAATQVYESIAPMMLSVAQPADCEALAEPVVAVVGPLGRSIPPAPREADRGVGTVALPAGGCRFDLATGDLVHVLLADPARWEAWVEAKERSPARTRYVEREVSGRPAIELVNALLVSAESTVLEVETQDIAGTDAELDWIRENLAALVLD